MEITYQVPLFIIAWFVQMGLHEGGHAYTADYFGDDTARLLGKKSFNPLNHIEWDNFNYLILAVGLPVFSALQGGFPMGMAWVPINPARMRNRDIAVPLVSFAGPLANFLLLIVCLGLHFVLVQFPQSQLQPGSFSLAGGFWLLDEALFCIYITSAIYGMFNLVPIPPIDGASVLRYFLPKAGKNLMDDIAPYGFFILMALFFIGDMGSIFSKPLFFLRDIWLSIGV